MVVAIIVAILAAVAVPLMSGSRKRAMATETMAGCAAIERTMRLDYLNRGEYSAYLMSMITNLPGIGPGDLNGTYFQEIDYRTVRRNSGQGFRIDVRLRGQDVHYSFQEPFVVLYRQTDRQGWGGRYLE